MGAMDNLLGPAEVAVLHRCLAAAAPVHGLQKLMESVPALDPLSLRSRTDLLAGVLAGAYPSYAKASAAYRSALQDPGFEGWIMWPVSESAVTLALADGSSSAFDDVLELLAELTPRLTSEFAIRRLLQADLNRALDTVGRWVVHPDPRVRRLASEGTRPYLPWAIRVPALTERPRATLPILDALRDDPSEDVRRSVANHLNDISRHAPEITVQTAARWQETASPATLRVIRHGLRTLIKKADPNALALLGFTPAEITVEGPESPTTRLSLPGRMTFGCTLENTGSTAARLAVDYVVHYVKANGQTAPKVFKLAVLDLAPGERRTLAAAHEFRQMTTRRHYAGKHSLQLQVNGVRYGGLAFELELAEAADPSGQ
ncbi:DNA alkylation repair protein [Arthrobacter sp. Edens01]|nr:DNA alkylation repair protein [Arthrobacter sp. Edens01]